jgi:hypothetical protein
MPYTFADLKDEIRRLIWPEGEAEELVPIHDKFFVEALVDIQRWVDCYQYNNTQLYRACSRFYVCGLNVMDMPQQQGWGSMSNKIVRVSVVDQLTPDKHLESASAWTNWCSRVYYEQVPYCKMLEYQQQVKSCSTCGGGFANFSGIFGFGCGCRRADYPVPTDEEYLAFPALPLGHHYQPQVSTDSRFGRAQRGVWAQERGRFYIAPYLQRTETVILEWDGIKGLWDDNDLVEDNPQLKRAVRYYVSWQHLKDYDRDDVGAAQAQASFIEARRGMMRDCREETRVRGCEGSNARQAVIPSAIQGGPADQVDPVAATLQNADQLATECPDVPSVTFDPPAGSTVAFPIYVVMTATAGDDIYFTTDGSIPTRASFRYTGPVQFSSDAVIRAIAVRGECTSVATYGVSDADYSPYVGDGVHTSSFSRRCSTGDQAGPWFVFTPNGSSDHIFDLNLSMATNRQILDVEVYRTDTSGIWNTGKCWATQYLINPVEQGGGTFASFPLVMFENGSKLHGEYVTSVGEFAAGAHAFTCYGETLGYDPDTYYKCIVKFGNNERVYFFIGTQCSDQVGHPCQEPVADGDRFTSSFEVATVIQDGVEVPAVTITATWALVEDDGVWVLGKIEAVTADGSTTNVTLSGLTVGTGYAPGETAILSGASWHGISVGGCVAIPPLTPPDPTTTTTTTTTSTTTTSTTPSPCDCPAPGACSAGDWLLSIFSNTEDGEYPPGPCTISANMANISMDPWTWEIDSEGTYARVTCFGGGRYEYEVSNTNPDGQCGFLFSYTGRFSHVTFDDNCCSLVMYDDINGGPDAPGGFRILFQIIA